MVDVEEVHEDPVLADEALFAAPEVEAAHGDFLAGRGDAQPAVAGDDDHVAALEIRNGGVQGRECRFIETCWAVEVLEGVGEVDCGVSVEGPCQCRVHRARLVVVEGLPDRQDEGLVSGVDVGRHEGEPHSPNGEKCPLCWRRQLKFGR